MTTYWLSRNGGEPEGPFAVSQIISMWGRGQFTAVDLLCEDGAQDWQPAKFVMQYVDAGLQQAPPAAPVSVQEYSFPVAPVPEVPAYAAAPTTAYRNVSQQNSCLGALLVLFGVIGLFFYVVPGLVLFALSAMVSGYNWTCSACGNKIERTSRFCPACKARLVTRKSSSVYNWILVVFVLLGIAFVVWVHYAYK